MIERHDAILPVNISVRSLHACVLTLVGLMAAACAPTPVNDDSQQEMEEPSAEIAESRPSGASGRNIGEARPVHIVRAGETLWSIAWRYNVDVNDMVRWNALENPNLIVVDQRLFIAPASASVMSSQEPSSPANAASSASVGRSLPPPTARSAQEWQWPVRGPVVSAYGAAEATGKGIGIGGEIGDDVRAAAPGQVVYAGDGLAAYGNLVIIRHDETYLSAYGQNDRLLVGEGDSVTQGQVIASMGLGPERQPHVHFEIRRNGTPVNPLPLLPD